MIYKKAKRSKERLGSPQQQEVFKPRVNRSLNTIFLSQNEMECVSNEAQSIYNEYRKESSSP